MYEKNGKVYLDENEYLNESYEAERNIRTRRNSTLTGFIAGFITALLIIFVFLIPVLLWVRNFREQHPQHPEESQTAAEVTVCTSN